MKIRKILNQQNGAVRIGFLIGQLGQGGAERQVYLITTALLALGTEPVVLTFDPSGIWVERLQTAGVKVFHIPRHANLEFRRLSDLRIQIQKLNLQILFCFGEGEALYGRLAVLGLSILAVPGLRSCSWSYPAGLWTDWLLKFWTPHYIVNSNIGKQYLEKSVNIPSSRISLIENAVERQEVSGAGKFLPDPRPTITAEHALWCGWVGSFIDVKDPALLVGICAQTCHQVPNLHYLVVGDGPLHRRVEKESIDAGLQTWLHFVGELPYASAVWQYLDFGLSTSLIEGTPNVLLEAMLWDKPYIAPSVGDFPYWIEDNKNGLLCKSRNPTDLANCVVQIAQDTNLRQKLSFGARQTAGHLPTPLQVAQKYLNLANHLAGQN